jgi:hypothetical protein
LKRAELCSRSRLVTLSPCRRQTLTVNAPISDALAAIRARRRSHLPAQPPARPQSSSLSAPCARPCEERQETVIDPRTLKRTLVGLFDMISPPALPFALEKLNLFILLDCESKSVERFNINILSPSGQLFCDCPACMAEWQSRTCECEPTFHDVGFDVQGDYRVQVSTFLF